LIQIELFRASMDLFPVLRTIKNTNGNRLMAKLLIGWILLIAYQYSFAEGEAGALSLRGQGHFYVGAQVSEPAENGSVQVRNQMYVGYQLAAGENRPPYPLVLVHGGGGQSTDWFSTPDGRDGWRDYFLAAGFDVYWVDRPGFGRSPTNLEYGELGNAANTSIITFLSTSERWPGNPADHADPSILAWMASSPPGPYAGNMVSARGLAELLERIGPAILVTHSAGAVSGWWAADLAHEQVAGIIAIEPGASNVVGNLRRNLSFAPPLPEDFEPVRDAEDCELQPAQTASVLSHYEKIPVHLVGSELGLVAGLPCAVKAFSQAGVNVRYTYLPDLGLRGNGHFMMAETNNGDIAQIIIDLAKSIADSAQ
jgi:pimeloyl-ACP methyl ester carboxylesterase